MKQSALTQDRGLRCQPMNIAFADGRLNPVQELELVIPTGSTVIQAAGCDAFGVRRSLLLAAPFAAVFPTGAQLATIANNDSDGWVIALRPDVLGQVSRDAFGVVPRWSNSWDPFLCEAARTLDALHHPAELMDAACADAFADVVSVHIALHYGRCEGAFDPNMPLTRAMLARIRAYVHEHIAETILVEQLALHVHMGASNFARSFKTATGNSPHLYVTLKRVNLARTMLREETSPLVDVGARVGFRTQQHFTDVFHRYTGATPRAYRLAHLKVGS